MSTQPSISNTATPASQRNLWLLFGAQALGGASPPIIISLGGLVGMQLASDPALATLPVSLFNLGLALSTIPAALLMRYLGRRQAYVLGAVLAIIAALIAAFGIAKGSFVQFCIGTTLAGFYAACVQNYRFAASDSVVPKERPKAISRIMIGGLVAAIIGPQVVIWTHNAWSGAPYAGGFVSQAVLALLALGLLAQLRLPSLQFAASAGEARSLWVIARQQRFVVAVVAGIVSYGLMAFIMTAAPMAMVAKGFSKEQATLGIQWHVLAMFGPSFITGTLIARFGKLTITAAGLAIIGLSGLLAFAGQELFHFWGSLILLGIGWNFGFIGATAMVTDTYSQAERAKAQAMNDFLIFGTVACGSFGSGYLLNEVGWISINLYMLPVIGAVLLLLLWLRLTQPVSPIPRG
ncbi:MAG: MFS transporter [Thiopseudomonas sp.]|nr:MFS transporter [Thiopseudomonas sp.]